MKIANNEKEYQTKSHITFSCQYHVIFCPKYRRPVLEKEAIAQRLQEVFEDIALEYNFQIVELEIMPEHVHLLIDCNPRFGIMSCIHKLKGVSSRTLRDEFPSLKSRIPTLWTRSAFVSSVGSVSLEVVKQYIEKQKGV